MDPYDLSRRPRITLSPVSHAVNPYAVTSPSDAPAHPIHFGGTLNRDDLMVSMRDSAPQTGWARFRFPVLMLAIVVVLGLIETVVGPPGMELTSVLWPVLAYPLLPAWLWFVRMVTPSQRRRRNRLEEAAKHCTLNCGWMDDERFVIYDADMFLRARWSFFGSAFVFNSHLLLPLAADSTHRIVLPFRFFATPADVKQSLDMVGEHVGMLINDPPKEHEMAEQVQSTGIETQTHSVQATLSWDANDWPFDSNNEAEQDFDIDLTAGQKSAKFAMLAMFGVFIFMVWYFLPVWAAVIGWLLSNYLSNGDWTFLLDQIAGTAIVVGPAAFILIFFLYSAIAATIQIRRAQSQPFSIRLRPEGIHLTHENFQSWFRWSAVEQVLVEDDAAGWRVKENKDEVKFPSTCFTNESEFERFQKALENFGPTIPSYIGS